MHACMHAHALDLSCIAIVTAYQNIITPLHKSNFENAKGGTSTQFKKWQMSSQKTENMLILWQKILRK